MLQLNKIKDHIFFKTKRDFYGWLIERGVDIDLNKSLPAFRYTIYINGERIFHSKLLELIKTLNKKLSKENKLCETRSRVKGKNSYLVFLKNFESSEDAVEEELEDMLTPVIDTPAENVIATEFTEEISDDTEAKEVPDFNYAESLAEGVSKAEGKNALEAYAREFDIELAKNKKFEDMLSTFKEEFNS